MTKDSSRPSHAKVHKIDNASIQKHVRWIFVIFYLFNLAQLKYKTMYIKYLGRETTVVLLVTDGLDSCNLSHCSPGVRHYIHIHTECQVMWHSGTGFHNTTTTTTYPGTVDPSLIRINNLNCSEVKQKKSERIKMRSYKKKHECGHNSVSLLCCTWERLLILISSTLYRSRALL